MSELRQRLIRSLVENGAKPRLVVSNESASDWLIRVWPLARELNEQSKHDGDAA